MTTIKDTTTGLTTDVDVPLVGYTPDPPAREMPVTAFLAEEDSTGVWREITTPGQQFPTIDPRPA